MASLFVRPFQTMDLKTLLKISRPGLWLVYVWLYMWPTGGHGELAKSFKFWLGLVYCILPLNLMVYGMNDMADLDVDAINDRKNNYVYGAKATKQQLSEVPSIIVLANGLPIILMAALTGEWVWYITWLLLALLVNVAYNRRPLILSRRGPWELPCMAAGNFLVPILSCKLNNLPLPPLGSWLFHLCMLWRTHIWFEIMDMYDDAKTDKRTLAVKVGHSSSCVLVLTLTSAEAAVAYYMLHCIPLALFSLSGVVIFLCVEVLPIPESLIPQDKTSKKMMSNVQSLGGILLLFYVWSSGVFVRSNN
ncbi:hypothetical protein FOZ61_003728 [Perkinsus olseni]|uniref:UbiA prenyltransferase domain-containing protein 1 n=1 Tax=Perkinsus olseni TaxID=32597 RepID=A0A7J6LNE6_PEROL|nr:hypothetical protein FOZ61_003728 [Perkinsus olseni]KAF4661644.1 hypothetical protein FOL46_005656 [Perkinsus olseni]